MPARPPASHPRRRFVVYGDGRGTYRATLVIESLEDRAQPSATPLAVLPAVPLDWTALVRPADETASLTSAPAATLRHELVLIDRDVGDRDALVRDLLAARPPGTAVEMVELTGGGMAEVSAILARYTGLDAVHLLSHGQAGALHLGADILHGDTLDRFATDLRGWGRALNAGADLLLYGCDLASGTAGHLLADRVAALTGADVAASTDLTGAAALGGNWDLEYRTGAVEAASLLGGDWAHTLTTTSLLSFGGTFTYQTVNSTGLTSAPLTSGTGNSSPTATDDNFTTNEDVAVSGSVLANDTDPDGDTLTASINSLPTNGSLTFNADGTFTYTPRANFNGTDSFSYTADDGNGGTATATVTITVSAVNDAPVAANDSYTTPRNTTLAVPAPGTLINDTDVDGDVLTAVRVSGPQNGTLQLNPDGSFVYVPTSGFVGTDSFTYVAVDPSGATSGTATVLIQVGPPPPVAVDDVYTANGELQVNRSAGVLANDGAAVGVALAVSLVSGPTHGVLFLGHSGGFLYVPRLGFTGDDSFTYQVTDPFGRVSAPATVAIHVVTPRAAEESYTVVQDQTLVAPALGEADFGFTATLLTAATHGTATVAADGSFTYTPFAGYTGTDTFTFRLSDGVNEVVFTVQITVVPAPPPPQPVPQPAPAPTDAAAPAVPTASGPTLSESQQDNRHDAQPGAGPTGPRLPVAPLPSASMNLGFPDVISTGGSSVVFTTSAASGPLEVPTATTGGGGVPNTGVTTSPVVLLISGSSGVEAPAAPAASAPRADVPASGVKPPPPDSPAPAPTLATPVVPLANPEAPVTTVPPASPDAGAAADAVAPALDKVSRDIGEDAEERAVTDAVVTTAVAATAGYVLLNTRALSWFISALLARPAVWRRFDPIDVIYSWEQEQELGKAKASTGDEDESLQSMVG